MIVNDISVRRITCTLSNVCTIDVQGEHIIRLVALYVPASKSWEWSDLSTFITGYCMIMGDFKVDIEKDGEKADRLLEWMDSNSMGSYVPDTNTSLRSDRIIDYVAAVGVDPTIQAYEGITCSDHKPIFGKITRDIPLNVEGSYTSWSVFFLALTYTSDYWEKEWNLGLYNIIYGQFISFLVLLVGRCKKYFPIKRARLSIPSGLIKLLAQCRSLSYKAKRKGVIALRQEAR